MLVKGWSESHTRRLQFFCLALCIGSSDSFSARALRASSSLGLGPSCRPHLSHWEVLRSAGGELYQAFLDKYPITHFFYGDCQDHQSFGDTRAKAPPAFWKKFDWTLEAHECPGAGCSGPNGLPGVMVKNAPVPKTIYTRPALLRYVLGELEKLPIRGQVEDRILVVGSGDANLTKTAADWKTTPVALASFLHRYFKTIWWMARDVDVGGVRTMPIGLLEHYLRGDGVVEGAEAAIAGACTSSSCKPRMVLAAFGEHSPTRLLCEMSECVHGCTSRVLAEAWSLSHDAQSAGVERRALPKARWWSELATYRFLISPLGCGIQSPKTIEALLVLTVPLVQRGGFAAHDDLVAMGFPLVLLDRYTEVTSAALSAWWRELEPRLGNFRRNCLTAEGYWKLITSERARCD